MASIGRSYQIIGAPCALGCKAAGAALGLIWVDAHPDLETPETTPTGYLHRMAAAFLLGFGPAALTELGGFAPKIRAENVAFVGLREMPSCERDLTESHGMAAYAADAPGLACVEVLEVIPDLDRDGRASQLAVSFLRSVVLGKRVYRSRRIR